MKDFERDARATASNAHGHVGTEGVWILVFIDMVIFTLIFFVFMSERLGDYADYKSSQLHLNVLFGLANTLVLLTSSWLVVEAVRGALPRGCAPVRELVCRQ